MEAAKPGKEHKEKKHKEKKHKEKKRKMQQPESEKKDKRKKKDKHKQQAPASAAAPAPAAAAAAAAAPSGSGLPPPPLPFDGLSLQQLQFSCPLDFAAAKANQDEEVWVLRLPAGLPGSLLHGCSIHMPAEPPAAHHTAPTPNRSQKDAAADPQQQQGKAHAPAQVIGHVALDGSDAATHDVYRYREVLQEDEFLVKRLRVAGPATGQPYKPSQRLECVKVARLLSISDDVRTVSRKQLQAAVAAGAELGPAAWDGKLPPSKLRTRIGGWRVLGEEQQQQQQQQQQRKKKGSSSSSSSSGDDADDEDGGSSSDEEFQEIVFENSTAGAAAAGSGSSNDGSNEQQQQQGVDPDHRFYSSSSDDEQQQGSAAGLKDYWDVLNERFNLGKFLLKLPVQPDVAAAQRAVYPSMQAEQQQQDDSSSSSDDEDSSSDSDSDKAPAAAAAAGAGSSKKAAAGATDDGSSSSDDDDDGKPFSDEEDAAGAAAMDVDGDNSEGWDEDDDDKPAKHQQQQQQQQQQSAVQQQNLIDNSGSWGAPPRPLRELVGSCLGWAEQQQLAALGSNKQLQRRLTNVAQLVRIDWGDVCAQLDMDAMSDYQTEMLLKMLQLREQFSATYDSEGEALQLQLLLPAKGSSRRPHFMDTDAGYAYYQAADAVPVLPPVSNAQQLDEQWAALLLARGAGKLATFVDTEALRARGFAWDDDPQEQQREGMHVEA